MQPPLQNVGKDVVLEAHTCIAVGNASASNNYIIQEQVFNITGHKISFVPESFLLNYWTQTTIKNLQLKPQITHNCLTEMPKLTTALK